MPDFELCKQAISSIRESRNSETLLDSLMHYGQHFGFTYFGFARHIHVSAGIVEPRVSHNFPQAISNMLAKKDFTLTDGLRQASHETGGVIRWDNVCHIDSRLALGLETLQQNGDVGIGTGCSLFQFLPQKPVFSVHFAIVEQRLTSRQLMAAQLLGHAVCNRARQLWQPQRGAQREATTEKLSPRQIECIKYVALGKTSSEIARTLGISELTVTEYLDDARKRLGVAKRVQLVLKAVDLDYFAYSDIFDFEDRKIYNK